MLSTRCLLSTQAGLEAEAGRECQGCPGKVCKALRGYGVCPGQLWEKQAYCCYLPGLGWEPTGSCLGRGHQVWDAIVVVVIVTLVADSVLIGVQLGTINDGGAVVCAVLVAIPVTAEENYSSVETLPRWSLGGLSAGGVLSDPIRPFFDKATSETTPPQLPFS